MAKKRTWTNEQLIAACKKSNSIRQVLNKLNLRPAGGNYAQIKKYIKILNIELTIANKNGKGQGWRKGLTKPVVPQCPLEDILKKDVQYQSSRLRQRLIKAGLLESKCSMCKLENWLDKPIPLELDHVNGDRLDNRLENLRLLCPNCHAFTPTYRGKNKKGFKRT